jgi:hypothetical protein
MKREDIFDIAYGDHPDYKSVTKEEIYDQTRWSVYKSIVVKHTETGKFYTVWWGEGATENQDGQDEPCGMYEVEPKEVTVIEYYKVDGGEEYENED